MAKDPAMLWYWSDWHSGTALLSRFLKGCYIDILHAQFNNGRLSLEEIKTCLGSDFGQSWPTLQKKFKQDEKGLFFNERLEQEKLKREAYSDSRRRNKSPKQSYDTTHDEHMIGHMVNTNIVLEKKEVKGGKWNAYPGVDEMNLELPDIKAGVVMELFLHTKNKKIDKEQSLALWRIFKGQYFSGDKFYATKNETYRHFINWCKTQTIDSGTQKEKNIPSGPTLQKI